MPGHSLGADFLEHKIFNKLKEYASFYGNLSFQVMHWLTSGTTSILNMDTYVFSSIQGTLESIHDTLIKGRIGDAYSLLRKFYDVTIINIYSNLYLEENFDLDNFIVAQINGWIKGTQQLPEYRVMSQYIRNSSKLQPITALLIKDDTYKNIRDRCNDH